MASHRDAYRYSKLACTGQRPNSSSGTQVPLPLWPCHSPLTPEEPKASLSHVHPWIQSSTSLLISLSCVCPFENPSVHPSIHPPAHSVIRPPIHTPMYPSVCPAIHSTSDIYEHLVCQALCPSTKDIMAYRHPSNSLACPSQLPESIRL